MTGDAGSVEDFLLDGMIHTDIDRTYFHECCIGSCCKVFDCLEGDDTLSQSVDDA